MATGRRPFQGRSSAELASAILRDAPPALEEGLRGDWDHGLALAERAMGLNTFSRASARPGWTPGIRVASRTSAFRARQEGHELAEIARLLSVGHVLEGSVRAAGTRLRVTAQLTDAATGYQLWSERFDREASERGMERRSDPDVTIATPVQPTRRRPAEPQGLES